MSDGLLESSGPWLIRIARTFEPWVPELLALTGAPAFKQVGPEFWLLGETPAAAFDEPGLARFIRWRLPVHHSWPCQPRRMAGFIEKASQTLRRKFGPAQPQTILCGPLDASSPDPYYKTLASNLRGRALQVLPPCTAATAEEQHPAEPTLFCLVGQAGLYCGMASPRLCHGFHPGGTRFIRQGADDTISRAGAKLAEALHHLRLYRQPPPPGAHWLELGASPGGMTAELLARGYRVTAIGRAPLDPRLGGAAGLVAVHGDVARFIPPPGDRYQAILCDLNGGACEAMRQVCRLASALVPGGLVIFTLKTTGVAGVAAIGELASAVLGLAATAGLRLLAESHLTYNRHEFTWFLQRPPHGGANGGDLVGEMRGGLPFAPS